MSKRPHNSATTTARTKHHSIRASLRWSYLISSTVPLIIVGTLLIYINFRAQQQSVYNELVSLATQASRDTANYISPIETKLLSIGHGLDADSSQQAWDDVLSELINTFYPTLRAVQVVDTTGQQVANLTYERLFTPPTTSPQISEDPLVLLAIQGLGQRSDIYETKQADDAQPQYVFDIVLPLRNNKRASIGAIKAEVNALPIEQSLRVLERNANSTIYLVNTKENTVMPLEDDADWIPPANIADVLNGKSGKNIAYKRADARVVTYRSGNNQPVLGVIVPIQPSNWSVVVEQPVSVAFGNLWTNVLVLAVLVAVVGLIALVWGLYTAQRFVRSLHALQEGAELLGAGNLEHRIAICSGDEMQQLANTFNQMAEQLHRSLDEVEQQNRQLREGLRLARDIQVGLLPTSIPWNHQNLTAYARSIPASEVGGDFYSYISLPNGNIAIAIGDISGKGVGAALMMALTFSSIETHARQNNSPSDVLSELNHTLQQRLQSNHMNAAILYALFDMKTHTMTVANAGMIAPVVIHAKPSHNNLQKTHTSHVHKPHTTTSISPTLSILSHEFIEVGGFPVGSMPNAHYHCVTIPLHQDDMLLFMSDGVLEAHNQQKEMFGFERFDELLHSLQTLENAQTLVEIIFQRVQEFIGKAHQHDDMTIVAVKPHTQYGMTISSKHHRTDTPQDTQQHPVSGSHTTPKQSIQHNILVP